MTIATRRALIMFAAAVFIGLFIAVVADAASRRDFIVLASAWLGAIVLFVAGVVIRLRRSRAIVRAALEVAGFEVLKMNYRYLRLGPFFSLWDTSRAQDVYRVSVRNRSSGTDQTVWARWGRRWFAARPTLEFRCEDSDIARRLNADIAQREHVAEHPLTGLAIAVTLVLLAPGEIAGYVVALPYRWAMAYLVEESLLDHSTGGWALVVLLDGFSGIVQGAVAGTVAAYVCARVVKRADYLIVAYYNLAMVIGFAALALVSAIINDGLHGLGVQHFGIVAHIVGLVSGLLLAARRISARQDLSRFPTPAPG